MSKRSNVTKAILETADDLHSIGLLSGETFEKITVRLLGPEAPAMAAPIKGKKSAMFVRASTLC